MQKFIEIKGKKYPLRDDIEYFYIKRYNKLIDAYNKGEIDEPDEKFIGSLAEAVCPTLKINFKDVSIDGKPLMFSEVKQLVNDLRSAQEDIMTFHLKAITETDKKGTVKVKNDEQATEAVT